MLFIDCPAFRRCHNSAILGLELVLELVELRGKLRAL
jgi:hypothetical protein